MNRLLRVPDRRSRSRVVLASVKTLTLAGMLCVMVAQGPSGGTQAGAQASSRLAEAVGQECAGALVRTTRGEVRQVSFEVGWDVYTGRRSGTLIAACLEEPRS